jgi:hypothetical protein
VSDRDPQARWAEPRPRGLGRLCPGCGAPLRATDTACHACGADPGAPAAPAHLMTPFGHGLCAFIGVFMLGVALRFTTGVAEALAGLSRFALALLPVAGGALAAYLAAWLGRRLLPQRRCAYEHLLIGGMVGGPCAMMAALAGLSNLESLLLVWAGAVGVTTLLMRRYGYRETASSPPAPLPRAR